MTEALRSRVAVQDTPLGHAMEAAASHCIKCGFCLPACPTYRETGHEAASPRGRLDLMYAVAEGRLEIGDIRHELSFCLGCLACETACPSGIAYRRMLDAGREQEHQARVAAGSRPWWHRVALNRLLVSPHLLRWAAWLIYGYQRSGMRRLLGSRGLLRFLPRLARLERRAPPLDAPRNWRREAAPYLAAGAPDGDSVALLSGCVMDAAFGAVHVASAKVLHANGCRVHIPEGQTCCGALHHHAGATEEAQALARRNIAAFEAVGDVPIVLNSAGCGALLKDYGHLLADDPDWADRATRVAGRVEDIAEFLARRGLRPPERRVAVRVAYDDPCHLQHAQRVAQAPRDLLAQVPGLELVPLAEADWCCGGAGTYTLAHPVTSDHLLARKLAHIRDSGAEVIATGNPGCLLQLRAGAHTHRVAVRIAHPVELLAEGYP